MSAIAAAKMTPFMTIRGLMLEFYGHQLFRERLILSTVSGKAVKISNIRSQDANPGLTDYEVLFLRFLETLTNGSSIEINYTGTEVVFRPGTILGGSIDFDCGLDRAISYFLEPVLVLAPLSKFAFKLKLTGLTAHSDDTSIDIVRTVSMKLLSKFGVSDGLDIKIIKRGSPPLGGGEIHFTCPILTSLSNVDLSDSGRIKKIRGIAAVTRISPQTSNRLVESGRSVLNTFIPDIYIYSDIYKGEEAGLSPGFGISLVAESTTGALVHADRISEAGSTPEEVGKKTAKALLVEVAKGGFISTKANGLVLILMSLTVDNLNKLVVGNLSEKDYVLIDEIKAFLGVSFKLKRPTDDGPLYVSCLGSGYINFNQRMH